MPISKSSPSRKTAKPPIRPAADVSDGETGEVDALRLLKADHQEVAAMFDEYEDLEEYGEKEVLAENICAALTVHAQIEEEIFYPAAREVLEAEDAEVLNEADVEHASVKDLVSQIEAADADDGHFDATVSVLGEYVKHHVQEEETELFPKLEEAGLDLADLGKKLAARKAELQTE
jgi:hypothetical protein